jgi:hypothetical protein
MPPTSDSDTTAGPGTDRGTAAGAGDLDAYTTITADERDPAAADDPGEPAADASGAWVTTEQLAVLVLCLELLAVILKLLLALVDILTRYLLTFIRAPVRVIRLAAARVPGISLVDA